MRPPQLQLLDLLPDALLRILVQLTFTERLRMSEVCRKLRLVCAGPTELWRVIDVRSPADAEVAELIPAFKR